MENIPGPGKYNHTKTTGEDAKSTKFSKEDKFHHKKIRPITPGQSASEKKTGTLTKSKSQGNLSKSTNYISENTLKNTIYKSNNFPGPACYAPNKIISSIGTK